MAKQSANVDEFQDEGVSTGQLEQTPEQDTNAQTIAAGILADLGDEPLIKKRTRKAKPVEPADDDDSAPPARLLGKLAEEPADDESDPATTEDGEEHEPSELETQLSALAQDWGVPPELVEGAESVAEAERTIKRLGGLFYHNGAAAGGQFQNGHAQQQAVIPAADAVQKKAASALPEIDLSDLDDDEPLKKKFAALLERDKFREQEMNEWRQEKDQQRQAEFQRVQTQMQQEFTTEFTKLSPELFGDGKRQTPQQYQRLCHVFNVANQMLMGAAASPGAPLPSVKAIARYATNAVFADDLANQKVLGKREQISQRQRRRSVGAPARSARAAGNAPSATVFEGPMDKDPDILSAVKGVLSRTRS